MPIKITEIICSWLNSFNTINKVIFFNQGLLYCSMQSGLDYASRKSLFGTPSHSPLWQFGNFSSPPVSENNCPFSFPTSLQTGLNPISCCLPQDPAQEKIPSLSRLEKRQDSVRLPTNRFIRLSQTLRKTLLPSTWLLPRLFLLNTTYSPFKTLQTAFCSFAQIIFLDSKKSNTWMPGTVLGPGDTKERSQPHAGQLGVPVPRDLVIIPSKGLSSTLHSSTHP